MKFTARLIRASDSANNISVSPDRSLIKARDLFSEGHARIRADRSEAEKLCRQALTLLRNTYLLTKDLKSMKLLHRYGKSVKKAFDCKMLFEDGFYVQKCPVALSHLKYGVSPGMIGKEVCSICQANMLDCEHIKGERYEGVVAREIEGVCNVCQGKACTHIQGQKYNSVRAIAFMTELRADHVALVENPKDPLAAIMSRTLDKEEIFSALKEHDGNTFEYGKTPLYCNHCLQCRG